MWSFMEENQNPELKPNHLKLSQIGTSNANFAPVEQISSFQFSKVSKELLQTELYNVTTYIDRLNFVLHHHEDLSHRPQIKIAYVNFLNSLQEILTKDLNIITKETSLEEKASFLVKELNDYLKFIELYFKLESGSPQFIKTGINILNQLFKGAFELHKKVKAFSILEVQPPKFSLTEIESNENGIMHFKIQENIIYQSPSIHEATISFIHDKKEDLYDKHLKKGHFFLLNKNNQKAKEHFNQAKNFKSTAEIFTLLGHISAKENNTDEAKEYCLKAIKTDPHFGAPYNDYGVYLLNEGLAKDALKWFALAKKSLHYQNRDFAYINCGRAYFALGEYELALDEFTKALAMNPENTELATMVKKIKDNLETKELKEFITKFKVNADEFGLNH